MITTLPIRELFSAPLRPGSTPNDLAESLLSLVANQPSAEPTLTYDDLTDRQSQRLIRPLLACLAQKSAKEGGTEFSPYGGTLSFVRKGKLGEVRITGEFENRPGAVWLTFHRPEPATAVDPAPQAKPATPSRLIDVFAKPVLEYRIAESGFTLADDLNQLDRVRSNGVHEAAILYCTRIVEAMARATIRTLNRQPCETMSGLMRELVEYRELPRRLNSWLDHLRYLGNDARHATRPVSEADADVAFVVLLRWLHWTFCEASHGPKLAALTVHNRPADALLPRELARLMNDADATGEAVLSQLTGPNPNLSAALHTPIVPAAAAEVLLAHGKLEVARQALDIALRRFPRDLRLRQLLGLYWSRRGGDEQSATYLHQARTVLEALHSLGGGSAGDEETFGILGGVYKRLANLDLEGAADWLKKSYEAYRAGWEQSRRTNFYLGINAATMELLQWQPGEKAEPMAMLLRDRIAALENRLRVAGGGDRPLSYWDQVTWAEAELLLREWDQARTLYRDAFARFASRIKDIEVTVGQARRILDRFGETNRAEEILGR